jgi:hypothetical protein
MQYELQHPCACFWHGTRTVIVTATFSIAWELILLVSQAASTPASFCLADVMISKCQIQFVRSVMSGADRSEHCHCSGPDHDPQASRHIPAFLIRQHHTTGPKECLLGVNLLPVQYM